MESRNFIEILQEICDIPSHRLAHTFNVPREVAEIVQEAVEEFMKKNSLYIDTKRQAYLERVASVYGKKDEG